MDQKTIDRVKFYTPKGSHPRLPFGSQLVGGIYQNELLKAAKKADIEGMRRAKGLLYYCLN